MLDAFCSACENESSETSVSLPGVKRRQRVAADRDRIRRSFFKNGYRLIVQHDGKRVRLFHARRSRLKRSVSRSSEAVLRNRNSSFVIDGEPVMRRVDGSIWCHSSRARSGRIGSATLA